MGHRKINWVLILQGWTMLWVVIGHAPLDMVTMSGYAKLLFAIAYSFHMPLFFMISGFLFYFTRLDKYKETWTYSDIMSDKFKRLGVPAVFFTIIAMLLKTMFSGDMSRPSEISLNEFINAFLYPTEGPLMELWFVAALLWMFICTPLWHWAMNDNYKKCFVFVILIICALCPSEIKLFCINKFLQYAIFFYVGLLLCKHDVIHIIEERKYVLLISSAILWFGGNVLHNSLLMAFGGIFTSLSMALILDKFYPQIFSSFRNYTYQIFLMGIFAQVFVKMLYRRIDSPYFVAYILCILAGLYMPVIISKVLERVNNRLLLMVVGLKGSHNRK